MNAQEREPNRYFDPRPTASQLDHFRHLIQELTGLQFDDWRLDTLERALLARMSATGIGLVPAYLERLAHSVQRFEELSALFDQITVNETYFFRYPEQFDFLRDTVFPSLLRRPGCEGSPLRIWSAGCASGEEPYTVAIAATEALGPDADKLVQIVATDVSSAALAAAAQAHYRRRSLRLLDDRLQKAYFHRLAENRFVLCEAVKRMVLFKNSSLLADAHESIGAWDLILCRNVLIYFAPHVVPRVLDGLCRSLREKGYLFVGHSEILKHQGFVLCQPDGAFIYRRVAPRRDATPEAPRVPGPPAASSHCAVPPPTLERSPQGLLEATFAALEHEDYPRAIERLDHLLETHPRHLPATLLRANVLLNLGQHEQSFRECEAALELDPFAAEAYLLLGINFDKLGKPELALAQLRKAAYIAPHSCIVQFHLGEAYRAAKMPGRARRAYENALSFLPSTSDKEIRTYLGGFGKSALRALCEQRITVR